MQMIIKCQICNKEISVPPSRAARKYCSRICQGIARHNKHPRVFIKRKCLHCGSVFIVDRSQLKHGYGKYCSKSCSSSKHLNAASRHVRPDGYIEVCHKGKRHLEHRLIMEKKIGRELKTNEHVHHLDGNKQNNNINNLFICSPKEHSSRHIRKHSESTINKLKLMAKRRARDSRGRYTGIIQGGSS